MTACAPSSPVDQDGIIVLFFGRPDVDEVFAKGE